MIHFRSLYLFVLLLFGVTWVSAGGDVAYLHPQDLLTGYYNAINLGDYGGAYDLWMQPPSTYETFAAGFADTRKVEPYFGDLQLITTNASVVAVPAALVAYHVDGLVELYFGCFFVVQDATNSAGWQIRDANLYLSDQPITLENVFAYSHYDCIAGRLTLPTERRVGYSLLNEAPQFLRGYFDLINADNFANAYALWLAPLPGPQPNGGPPRDYRRPYQQFVNGYGDTAYIQVYSAVYEFGGAAAGKPYLHGRMQTVLIAQNSDSTFQTYVGCFVLGVLPSGALGIVNGKFDPAEDFAVSGTQLWTYLNAPCRSDIAI